MSTHTPGPWTADEAWYLVEDANGTVIADADGGTDEEARANTRLVACAPELLHEIKIVLGDLEVNLATGLRPSPDVLAYRDRLKALIAKAIGQPMPSHSPFAKQST